MVNIVNNTAHLIIIEGKMYIPRKPVSISDLEADELKSKYPEIGAMIRGGQLLVISDTEAAIISDEYEQMEVDDLKAYAKSHGINIGKANKKESILEAIRKAEAERLTAKG